MKLTRSIFALIAGVVLVHSTAMAGQIKINFSDAGFYNGVLTPTTPSSTVWATALFEDTGVAGHVKLTMAVSQALASSTSYVSQWNFNVLNMPTITVTNIDAPAANTVTYASNCCQVNGPSGHFDLRFEFNTSNPGNLAQGADSIYELVGTNLTAASFNQLTPLESNGRQGGLLASVKVQGAGNSYDVKGALDDGVIDPEGEVPEPGTLALIGLGLLGASLTRRRSNPI